MKILNFDTALDKTYITLSEDQNILSSQIIENQNGQYHSAFLIPTIVSILKQNKLTIQDLDFIATDIGPGSFTGIRACLVVARTLCQQANIKALGISSLEILSKINDTPTKKTYVLLDARKNMAYTAIFDTNGKILQKPCADFLDNILVKLKEDNYFVVCDTKMSEFLTENNIECINYQSKNYDLGKFLNDIAYKTSQNNCDTDFNWAKLKPLYIQPPPISKPKALSKN